MSLLNGKADETAALAAQDTGMEVAEAQTTGVPQAVRAFDQFGRAVMVPREQWRTEVLPGMVKQAWDEPEHLYMLIANSLNDGFVAEVTEAAEHLYGTDPLPARGACMWGIVLIQSGRLDEAERVLSSYNQTHAEDGSVLVNLAKVYAARGDMERAETTLWQGLEVEPNQENGLGWYAAIARERGTGSNSGDASFRDALKRVAALPDSWRAQLWLAREELSTGNLEGAKTLYAQALERAPRPVPPDFLMQMSGDLGGHGHLPELVEFTAPHFVPEMHGMPVGNNLIKANFDLGRLDAASAIKDSLLVLDRPDWKDALAFWDAEIAKRRAGIGNAGPGAQPAGSQQIPEQQIQIGMLRVDGPVWLPPGSPAHRLFGAKAPGPAVTFLGGSAEAPQEDSGSPQSRAALHLSEAVGRMTRALPLYLAEQVEMRTAAHGRAMLPWAVGQPGTHPSGFVVSGARWPDETAIGAVQEPANFSEYVVTVHVDAEVEPWEASLVFVRANDGTRIGELQADFSAASPGDGLPGLADEVVDLLNALGEAQTPEAYTVPGDFGAYLLRLEQLLTVRCATMDGVGPGFLRGEREILDGDLALCAADPENVPARVLLVETLGAVARVKPDAARAFQEVFARFRRDQPLQTVDSVFAGGA